MKTQFCRYIMVVFAGILMILGVPASGQAAPPVPPVSPQASATPVVTTSTGVNFYYYADGQRHQLTPSVNQIAVRIKPDVGNAQTSQMFSAVTGDSVADVLEIPNPRLTVLTTTGQDTKALLKASDMLRQSDFVAFAHPLFIFEDGTRFALTDEFIVQFKPDIERVQIDSFNAAHHVEIVEETSWAANNYILRVTPVSDLEVLDMANLYHESVLTEYAEPNFVRLMEKQAWPNDTYRADQWSLRNTGQHGGTSDADIDADDAWDITTGSEEVIIAILDEGVETGHDDLRTHMVKGYDVVDGDNDSTPRPWDAHGTNCAGLAAGTGNNSQGVAGVSWSSKIMPVRIAYSVCDVCGWVTYDSWIANAINWAWQHDADVLSNSWGGGSSSSQINAAISNAKTYGRNGRGSVVVFSAGNDNGAVSYPATLSSVIAVGATNLCDQRKQPFYDACNYYEDWWGSNYGSQLDIAAPGVALHSTDISLTGGYSSGSYFTDMNGTSGAAPHVAGAAALVLSVNPTLTAAEVQTILQNNADDKGAAGWDSQFGWGRLNAYQSVNNTPHYLDLESQSLVFWFDDSSPNSQIKDIVNLGTNSSTWSATCTSGCGYFSLGTPSGYTPSTATVTVDKTSLGGYGTYNGAIQVASNRTLKANSPQTVNITIVYQSSFESIYLPIIVAGSAGGSGSDSGDLPVGFSDDMESGGGKWTAESPWGRTTSSYYNGSYSWADSPSGDYANNRIGLTLTSDPFSLSGIVNPQLSFYTHYDIEYSWDYGLVEISTDSLSWEMVGIYTGYQSTWTQKSINLSDYANAPYVQIRFRLETDSSVTEDGWYIDDIVVN